MAEAPSSCCREAEPAVQKQALQQEKQKDSTASAQRQKRSSESMEGGAKEPPAKQAKPDSVEGWADLHAKLQVV